MSDDTLKILSKLTTPKKIQDYINTLGKKPENSEYIVCSPLAVIKKQTANCMEGALLAAAAISLSGGKPLLLDLKVAKQNTADVDHVVALFKKDGYWGAISKTSHAVLRYREPIYKTLRELVLSYFHEYFTDDGKKNLRSFSKPFDISKHFGSSWISSNDDLWEIAVALDESPHTQILTKTMERGLRLADAIEIEAGKLTE